MRRTWTFWQNTQGSVRKKSFERDAIRQIENCKEKVGFKVNLMQGFKNTTYFSAFLILGNKAKLESIFKYLSA